ncbi:MAG: tRNA threonylcarbamoyladenosine dehydratase [Ruminococcaceae bacterium]|nr:tRNA threonylcarbamoyladenosine dehydratase [Oscillospiraceae bacterium]
MNEQFSRISLLTGSEALEKLNGIHVAVFGIGGVGASVIEALCRGGVGKLSIIDGDTVNITNINRQLIATHSTVGMLKTDAAYARLKDINPNCIVEKYPFFYTSEEQFDFSDVDYVVDAIDMVSAKLIIIEQCKKLGIPVISCMGTANKLDATGFEVADIKKTSYCPLARVMRRELKKRGIDSLKVVYSPHEPVKPSGITDGNKVVGSMSFVPPVAGFICAGEVIKDIIFKDK